MEYEDNLNAVNKQSSTEQEYNLEQISNDLECENRRYMHSLGI